MKNKTVITILLLCIVLLGYFLLPFGLQPKGAPAEFTVEPLEFSYEEIEALDEVVALDYCVAGDSLIYLDRRQDAERNTGVYLKQYDFTSQEITELARMEDITGKYGSLQSTGEDVYFVRGKYINPPRLDLGYELVRYNRSTGELTEYEGAFAERLYRAAGDYAWYWTYVGVHPMGLECMNLESGKVYSISKKHADISFSSDDQVVAYYDMRSRAIKRYDTSDPSGTLDKIFCRDKMAELAASPTYTVWRSDGLLSAYNHETGRCISFTPQTIHPDLKYSLSFSGERLLLTISDVNGRHVEMYNLEERICQVGTLPELGEFTGYDIGGERAVAYDSEGNRFWEIQW